MPKPNRDNKFYSWTDFNVAQDMTFFGRTYRLCDANRSTLEYLHRNGVDVNEPEDVPSDDYTVKRRQQDLPDTSNTTPRFRNQQGRRKKKKKKKEEERTRKNKKEEDEREGGGIGGGRQTRKEKEKEGRKKNNNEKISKE